MRYRMQTASGDYTFGQNGQNFFVNVRAGVGQAIRTTLRLYQGDWFLDLSKGVAWLTGVVGFSKQAIYDQIIQQAISGVQGVSSIVSYNSVLNATTRQLTVNVVVQTIYGDEAVTEVLSAELGGFGIGPYGLRPFGA